MSAESKHRSALTARSIEKIKAGAQRQEVPDALLPGLYFLVQPSGARSFAVRYRHQGRPRKLTIGSYPKIGLLDARNLGRAALKAVAEGSDPAAKKQEAKRKAESGLDSRDLLKTVWQDYCELHIAVNLRASTSREIKRLFEKHILPKWAKRRICEIDKRDVLNVLDAMVKRGAPFSANRMHAALAAFFNWCAGRGIIELSPVHGVKKPTKGEKARTRKLSDDEIRWLWRACLEIGFPFGPMTQLLLLTGARREEIRAVKEAELNAKDTLLTLPGERTKNKHEHTIHLSSEAISIIKSLPRIQNDSGYVFCTNGINACSGFSRAKDRLHSLMLQTAKAEAVSRGDDPNGVVLPSWRLHDLRRTMASNMARLGVALPVVERCLNHVGESFGGIVATYQQHDYEMEKKEAFTVWAAHVRTVVTQQPAKIIPIRSARSRRSTV